MNVTKQNWLSKGLCINCGKVNPTKFKWCFDCRLRINGNHRIVNRRFMNDYYAPYKDTIKIQIIHADEMSDGHHTISELYEHRHALFIALCKIYDNYITPLRTRITCWKSKFHFDGTMFDGNFILEMTVTEFTGPKRQITYHLPLEYWDKIKVIELTHAPEYDGHSSNDVLDRLMKL